LVDGFSAESGQLALGLAREAAQLSLGLVADLARNVADRSFLSPGHRHFLLRRSRFVDPVACTPAAGWEKGQVENQVGLARERFFTPRLRFKSDEEMNSYLARPLPCLRAGAPAP
jgi:hypothetical protein